MGAKINKNDSEKDVQELLQRGGLVHTGTFKLQNEFQKLFNKTGLKPVNPNVSSKTEEKAQIVQTGPSSYKVIHAVRPASSTTGTVTEGSGIIPMEIPEYDRWNPGPFGPGIIPGQPILEPIPGSTVVSPSTSSTSSAPPTPTDPIREQGHYLIPSEDENDAFEIEVEYTLIFLPPSRIRVLYPTPDEGESRVISAFTGRRDEGLYNNVLYQYLYDKTCQYNPYVDPFPVVNQDVHQEAYNLRTYTNRVQFTIRYGINAIDSSHSGGSVNNLYRYGNIKALSGDSLQELPYQWHQYMLLDTSILSRGDSALNTELYTKEKNVTVTSLNGNIHKRTGIALADTTKSTTQVGQKSNPHFATTQKIWLKDATTQVCGYTGKKGKKRKRIYGKWISKQDGYFGYVEQIDLSIKNVDKDLTQITADEPSGILRGLGSMKGNYLPVLASQTQPTTNQIAIITDSSSGSSESRGTSHSISNDWSQSVSFGLNFGKAMGMPQMGGDISGSFTRGGSETSSTDRSTTKSTDSRYSFQLDAFAIAIPTAQQMQHYLSPYINTIWSLKAANWPSKGSEILYDQFYLRPVSGSEPANAFFQAVSMWSSNQNIDTIHFKDEGGLIKPRSTEAGSGDNHDGKQYLHAEIAYKLAAKSEAATEPSFRRTLKNDFLIECDFTHFNPQDQNPSVSNLRLGDTTQTAEYSSGSETLPGFFQNYHFDFDPNQMPGFAEVSIPDGCEKRVWIIGSIFPSDDFSHFHLLNTDGYTSGTQLTSSMDFSGVGGMQESTFCCPDNLSEIKGGLGGIIYDCSSSGSSGCSYEKKTINVGVFYSGSGRPNYNIIFRYSYMIFNPTNHTIEQKPEKAFRAISQQFKVPSLPRSST